MFLRDHMESAGKLPGMIYNYAYKARFYRALAAINARIGSYGRNYPTDNELDELQKAAVKYSCLLMEIKMEAKEYMNAAQIVDESAAIVWVLKNWPGAVNRFNTERNDLFARVDAFYTKRPEDTKFDIIRSTSNNLRQRSTELVTALSNPNAKTAILFVETPVQGRPEIGAVITSNNKPAAAQTSNNPSARQSSGGAARCPFAVVSQLSEVDIS